MFAITEPSACKVIKLFAGKWLKMIKANRGPAEGVQLGSLKWARSNEQPQTSLVIPGSSRQLAD